MYKLNVPTSTHTYPIYIDEDIRFRLSEFIEDDYSTIFIITDDTIAPLYLEDVLSNLENRTVVHKIIPSGEASKSIEQYYALQTFAMENHLDRRALIIALGGGVVGDLAGFVAATFMRGIDFIQVPTTILAHDSSVGGKVAINHELGKNMIGNFYPPKAVVYDVNTLTSLPAHEVRSGYAEIIKEAFIANETLLHTLLKFNLEEGTTDALKAHLYEGVKVKAYVVEQDEKESHMRMFLNFGHTLAHALEAELGYGKVTHGEAVAVGMLFALRVSEDYYGRNLQADTYKLWMQSNNYPISLFGMSIDRLIAAMKLDKKTQYNKIKFVLLKAIGEPEIVTLEDEQITAYLEAFQKELNES